MASQDDAARRLEALRAPFPPEKVYQRQGPGGKQLDYVSIETVLERLLSVAPDYSMSGKIISDDGDTAIAECVIEIDGKTGYGVGAMKNPDTDMRVKSALSEALKNSLKNGFGVALELWDAEYRKALDVRRKLSKGSVAVLKGEVYKIAQKALEKDSPTAKEIAGHFGVSPAALGDAETLREILTKEGLL